jgi:hypothetical protein
MDMTREEKIETVLKIALEQVKKMVAEGRSAEDIALFNQSQLEAIAKIN